MDKLKLLQQHRINEINRIVERAIKCGPDAEKLINKLRDHLLRSIRTIQAYDEVFKTMSGDERVCKARELYEAYNNQPGWALESDDNDDSYYDKFNRYV